MQFQRDNIVKISDIQRTLSAKVKRHILVAHDLSGCDTVSALYNQGKKTIISVIQNDAHDVSYLDIFKERNSSQNDIVEAGDKLLLHVYGACATTTTLNWQRYVLYCRQLANKCLTSPGGFQPQSPSPTSVHFYYHYYHIWWWVCMRVCSGAWWWVGAHNWVCE